jgi:hypothetical protein
MKASNPKSNQDEEIKISFLGFKVEAKNPKLKSMVVLIIVLLFVLTASRLFSFI